MIYEPELRAQQRQDDTEEQVIACAECGHVGPRPVYQGEAEDDCPECGSREVVRP